MTVIIMGYSFHIAQSQRQHGSGSLQCLDLRLLIYAEHHGVIRALFTNRDRAYPSRLAIKPWDSDHRTTTVGHAPTPCQASLYSIDIFQDASLGTAQCRQPPLARHVKLQMPRPLGPPAESLRPFHRQQGALLMGQLLFLPEQLVGSASLLQSV